MVSLLAIYVLAVAGFFYSGVNAIRLKRLQQKYEMVLLNLQYLKEKSQ